MKYRVLVVDDSPFVRRLLTDWLKEDPSFEVVATASNGEEALAKVKEFKPDLITLDVEMPVMDGLSALERIMKEQPTPVLMVSSLTTQGAAATMRALELGAVDFFAKPQSSASIQFVSAKDDLLQKLRACAAAKTNRPIGTAVRAARVTTGSDRLIVIASSTGGPRALAGLWSTLPVGLPAPILITQHMPAGFTESLAKRLDSIGTVPCREAKPGDRIEPGQALLAPGGRHMLIGANNEILFDDGPSLHGVKPAADFLFHSAAKYFGRKVIGAVLTGMGRDGAEGAFAIRQAKGVVFGEAESTCTIYGMPKAAKDAGGIDAEFPINEMAAAIAGSLSERCARAS
ncbi:MAG: chemotaxis response regulator protein-glutamate methylesterase [Armatimonadetes bacterium]|nr:chemotaxis response regulator protein-glutamate methylesterase [Armatimonadota bacterium]